MSPLRCTLAAMAIKDGKKVGQANPRSSALLGRVKSDGLVHILHVLPSALHRCDAMA